MKIKIFKLPFGYFHINDIQFEIKEQGYIEAKKFDRNEFWDLCNWSCYTENKPENLFSDIEVANSDVIFLHPKTQKYHLALPFGWKKFNCLDSLIEYCLNYHSKK